jgi:Ca-activated chloride channel family protein
MKDFQPKDNHAHCIVWFGYAVLLIVTAGLTALAQLKPPNEIFGSPQSSQTTSIRSATSNEEQVIVNTDLVTLTVSVADPDGRYVPGLNRVDFSVTDNKIPQEIGFFSDADLPVSVGIVFDVSGSMSGKKIERAKEALSSFIQTSHPDDEYFLIGFSSQPQLLLDKSRDGEAVIKKLSLVEPHGSTALFDASYLALERVTRGVYPKRVILIISDGQDNNSRYTFSDLRRSLMESDVAVYAIGINVGVGVGPAMYGNLVLDELASVSGGKVFFPRNSTQMTEVLEQIALELRHQYSIGYRPSNFTVDGKWHRVRVKVMPPRELKRVFVRSREGYYAAGSTR